MGSEADQLRNAMSHRRFQDGSWGSQDLYAERAKIVSARRMEADDGYDDLYQPVIDALDVLLEHMTNGVGDDAWNDSVRTAQAQLLFAAFKNADRCDLFLDVSRALGSAELE
ncbi:TPA: hypothetical protein RZC51_001525 [Burkholderia cenocepacia]|nr:hypothetical protein [Burkholderia cenocepacia]